MKRMMLVIAAALLAATPALADSEVMATTVKGDPGLKSIEALSFAPGGILLVGDGRGTQIVGIMTGDTKKGKAMLKKIAGIRAKLAAKLGATAGEIEIRDMAVNPESSRIYFAVRKGGAHAILTLDGSGKIAEFPLGNVQHASIPLPKGVSRITDVAWAGGKLVAAARGNDEFRSKIFFVDGPLKHNAAGAVCSAESYHISHRRWETKAPMSVLMPYEENGKHFIVGAFSCTPVVKYPLDALKDGGKVKGISMLELGSGNKPLDMFTYTKGGKASVLVNTERFHHKRKPFGPSPYWTARFDRSILGQNNKINEKAERRLGGGYKPITKKVNLVESMHGVVQMDRLNDRAAIVIRKNGEAFDLEPVALP